MYLARSESMQRSTSLGSRIQRHKELARFNAAAGRQVLDVAILGCLTFKDAQEQLALPHSYAEGVLSLSLVSVPALTRSFGKLGAGASRQAISPGRVSLDATCLPPSSSQSSQLSFGASDSLVCGLSACQRKNSWRPTGSPSRIFLDATCPSSPWTPQLSSATSLLRTGSHLALGENSWAQLLGLQVGWNNNVALASLSARWKGPPRISTAGPAAFFS